MLHKFELCQMTFFYLDLQITEDKESLTTFTRQNDAILMEITHRENINKPSL